MHHCAGIILFMVFIKFSKSHLAPSFPGHDVNKPAEAHHHGQMHNQPAPAQSHPPSKGAREFGGEQVKNVEHIKEHLDGKVDPTVNMTPEQLHFHYFNMHDMDKNSMLDGIELTKAITHFHEENPDPHHQGIHLPVLTEEEIEKMLDPIFASDDLNWDGYISFPEFSRAQKQRDEQARRHQPRSH